MAAPRLAPVDNAPLAVTMGDPAGIGLDITLAAWADRDRHALPRFALFADPDAVEARANSLGLRIRIATVVSVAAARNVPADQLAVCPVRLTEATVPGRPSPANGSAVIAAIEAAVAAVVAGEASALVTNPISKLTLYATGFAHPGHTEFLAALADAQCPGQRHVPVMMLASDELRVVPATIHIPLADVARSLDRDRLVAIVRITAAALVRDFGIARPRIAVAGLNPHAGEGGTIGREDIEIIAPAIAILQADGLDVTGPLSADTMFHAAARARYDAAIAMYHDQALIPIKTLAFDRGVNVTLGLPFVRTSPDHGTAFDIAGKGLADPTSLIEAMRLAARMAKARVAART